MSTLNLGRRTILIGIGATLAGLVLAVVIVAALALWRFTEWGSEAVNQVTDAAAAVVAPIREDAQRAVEESKATVAGSVAAVALANEEARRAVSDATSTVARAKEISAQALGNPEDIIRRASDAAAQDASQAIAAAAAAVAPAVSEHLDAAHALVARAASHPARWPEGLALRQVHYRQVGNITEYGYLAVEPGFDVQTLRVQLVDLGYTEEVLAEGDGMLEAVYRDERQLLVSVSTRDAQQRIDVRELPHASTEDAGP